MDRYTKTVLTIIAIALLSVAVKLWQPDEAYSGFFADTPTYGELSSLSEIKDAKKNAEAFKSLINRLPVVYVYEVRKIRGSVSVD